MHYSTYFTGNKYNDNRKIISRSLIFQGLASGTLLYVVFFEILHKHRSGLLQYLSIILGFSVMFGLQVLSEYITPAYFMSVF